MDKKNYKFFSFEFGRDLKFQSKRKEAGTSTVELFLLKSEM